MVEIIEQLMSVLLRFLCSNDDSIEIHSNDNERNSTLPESEK